MDALQQSILQLSTKFLERMDTFEGELRKGSASTPNITTLAAEFSTFKLFVMEALHSLQKQFVLLANTVDQIEMRSRRKILLFHGIVEEKQEDTVSTIVKVIVNQMKQTTFQVTNIKRCYRMGKSVSTSKKPRPILVKFADTTARSQIWFAKAKLKDSGITLSEFLTKARHDLFMQARKQVGVSRCWTRDGTVFALSPDGTRHRLESLQDLDNICQDVCEEQGSVPASTAKESTVHVPKTRRIATKK